MIPTFAPPYFPMGRARTITVQRRRIPPPTVKGSVIHDDLRKRLSALSDSKYKSWHSNYLRHEVPVLGVRMPAIRKTVQAWAKDNDLSTDPNVKQIALKLFDQEFEEEKLAGVLLLHEVLQPLKMICTEDLPDFARVFDNGGIAYWNSCDWFCVKVLAQLIRDEGQSAMDGIAQWRDAENLWRARASVVGLLSALENEQGRRLMLECCSVVVKREERWAKSAVGWGLREASKVDKECVVQFLQEHLQWINMECVRNATKAFGEGEKKKWVKSVKEKRAK